MTYTIHYIGEDRKAEDEKALADLIEYIGQERYDALLAACQEESDLAEENPARYVQYINYAMSMNGISGRPFFAFCRKHFLSQFREWCHSSMGGGAKQTDEDGFFI